MQPRHEASRSLGIGSVGGPCAGRLGDGSRVLIVGGVGDLDWFEGCAKIFELLVTDLAALELLCVARIFTALNMVANIEATIEVLT